MSRRIKTYVLSGEGLANLRSTLRKAFEADPPDARPALNLTREYRTHDVVVCVWCAKPAIYHSQSGREEIKRSGICEPCFDGFCKEMEDQG